MKYFVKDDHTLGLVRPEQPEVFEVLAGNIHGHDWKNGPVSTFGAKLVPATPADFERFRVSPIGHI